MLITLDLTDDDRAEVVMALQARIAYLSDYVCRVIYLDDGTSKVIPSEQSIASLKDVLAIIEEVTP